MQFRSNVTIGVLGIALALFCTPTSALDAQYVHVQGRVTLAPYGQAFDPDFHAEAVARIEGASPKDVVIMPRTVNCFVAPCPVLNDDPGVFLRNEYGTAQARGTVNHGTLHAFASVETAKPPDYLEAYALAQSSENLLFTAPGKNTGDRGVLYASIFVDGPEYPNPPWRLERTQAGEAMWQLSMYTVSPGVGSSGLVTAVDAPRSLGSTGEVITLTGSVVHGIPFSFRGAYFTFILPFEFGREFSLVTSLSAGCSMNPFYGSQASCTADLDHSAYWAGIESVTDEGGTAISDFTIVSASGTDWTRSFIPSPIPEPRPLALLATGSLLLGIGYGARKSRKQGTARVC